MLDSVGIAEHALWVYRSCHSGGARIETRPQQRDDIMRFVFNLFVLQAAQLIGQLLRSHGRHGLVDVREVKSLVGVDFRPVMVAAVCIRLDRYQCTSLEEPVLQKSQPRCPAPCWSQLRVRDISISTNKTEAV